jgi:hypothetical protein
MFSGSYPPEEMGAMILFIILLEILSNFPLGVSETLTTYSSNAMGERNLTKARKYLLVAGLLISGMILIFDAVLFFFGWEIAEFFTTNDQIKAIAENLAGLYVFILPGDFLQNMLGGYIRGTGREKLGSISFLVCYYVIGLPLSFILGNIYGLRCTGLWIGMGVATYCMLLSCVVIVYSTNLRFQVTKVSFRMRKEKEELLRDQLEDEENEDEERGQGQSESEGGYEESIVDILEGILEPSQATLAPATVEEEEEEPEKLKAILEVAEEVIQDFADAMETMMQGEVTSPHLEVTYPHHEITSPHHEITSPHQENPEN